MTVVHIDRFGPGEIIATDVQRGRRQYKVAGPGWEVWVDETRVPHLGRRIDDPTPTPTPREHQMRSASEREYLGWAQVDHDNSVDLPYNPRPQYPAIPGDIESTIQPIHEIDPDERLGPADSITFDTRSNSEADRRGRPGPNPDLFAKSSSYHYADFDDDGVFEGRPGVDDIPPSPDDPMSLLQNQPGWQDKTLGDLLNEATQLAQMHPDWVDRPMGDLVNDPEAQGPPQEQAPPEFGGEEEPEPPSDEEGEEGSGESDESEESEEPSDEGESDETEENPFESSDESEDEGESDEDESEDSDESDEGDEDEVPEECQEYVEKEGQWQALIPLVEGLAAGGGEAGAAGAAGEAGMGGGGLGSLTKMLPGVGQMMGGGGDQGGGPQTDEQGHPLLPKVDPKHPLPLPDLGRGWGSLVEPKVGSFERPAGLDDKYIDLQAAADHYYDPVQMFRDDPVGHINRTGHVEDEGLNPRFAEYVAMVDSDPRIMEAAWKDVRNKALRLRRDGQVHVKDVAPDRIYATVQGDHGVYDTMITKGAAFSGLGGGHAISNWRCSCEWGKWAFRRRYTYVGRLCSHGYAAYMEMQSQHTKGQKRLPRQTRPPKRHKRSDVQSTGGPPAPTPQQTAPVTTPAPPPTATTPATPVAPGSAAPAAMASPAKPTASRHQADALQMVPQRLVPEMVINDQEDQHLLMDVTKDDRKTTGPGQIMHFSRLMAHCERTSTPYPRELVAFLVRYADTASGTVEEGDEGTPPVADPNAKPAASTSTSGTSSAAKPSTTVPGADPGGPGDTSMSELGKASADAAARTKPKSEKDVEEDKQADTGTTDPTKNPTVAGPAGGGIGGMGDMGGMMSMLPMIGDIGSSVAPMIGDVASSVVPMIGDLIGGLGGILGSKEEMFGHRLAAASADFPRFQEHEPFAGSGPMDPLEIGSSADHMKGIDYVDVTDIGDYDPSEYKQASRWFMADDLGGGVGNAAGNMDPGGVGNLSTVGIPGGGGIGTTGDITQAGGGMRSPGSPGGSTGDSTTVTGRRHYADDQTTQDWKIEDASEAGPDLEWLRDQAEGDGSEHLQNMADYVDEVQEHVQDARDAGTDASPLVASVGGGIKRAGKGPKRPPVQPTVVREYGGRKQAAQEMIPDIPDPYSKTAADFAEPEVPMGGPGGDIVAQFQRSAAAQEMLSGSGGGGAEEFDISGAANTFLQRTAGRNYSLAEQADLMNERHPLGARNLDRLDLEGTHYEAENSVGLW